MKSIAIFMLIGLGLLGNGHCDAIGFVKDECVEQALKNSLGVIEKIITISCRWQQGLNIENLEPIRKELTAVLNNINCEGTKKLLDNLEAKIDSITHCINHLVAHVFECGLSKTHIDAMCFMLNPKVCDQCVEQIVGSLTGLLPVGANTAVSPQLSAQKFYSMCKSGTLNINQIIEMAGHLTNMGCVMGPVPLAMMKEIGKLPAEKQILSLNVLNYVLLEILNKMMTRLEVNGAQNPLGTGGGLGGQGRGLSGQGGGLSGQGGGLGRQTRGLDGLIGKPSTLTSSILGSLGGLTVGLDGVTGVLGRLNGILSTLTSSLPVDLGGQIGIVSGLPGGHSCLTQCLGGVTKGLGGLSENLDGLLSSVTKILGGLTGGLGGH